MAEKAGYEAFYISGAMSHMWLLGMYDSGQITPTEFADNARRITKCVNIPVFSDADTAGGNPVNVYRTVKEFIHAGLAGCHIEDVQYPKGITTQGQNYGEGAWGHANARLVSDEEAVGRLKAAVEAKNELDPNFVLIARTDGRNAIGGGLEEAIRRGQEYEKIPGVDVIMFDGMLTPEETTKAVESVKLPAFVTGAHSDSEKIVFMVGLGWWQASQTAWETLIEFKDRGVKVYEEFRKRVEELPPELRMPRMYRIGFDKETVEKMQETHLPQRKD
jgi:methylisocitrate lyase